jgi:hypothetical protein
LGIEGWAFVDWAKRNKVTENIPTLLLAAILVNRGLNISNSLKVRGK